MAAPSNSNSPAEELARLLATGDSIEGEEMHKVAGEELVAAAADGNLDRVRMLIAAGADINAKAERKNRVYSFYGETALMAAVKRGHAEVFSTVLQAGADINAANSFRKTALMMAAAQEDTFFLRTLLEAGADVNAIHSACPPNALCCAAFKGNTEAVRLLLKAGATVNYLNGPGGPNALCYAARRGGSTEAARALLDAGALVNVCDPRGGSTPLITAAWESSVDMMRLLLAFGAEVNKRGRDGNTALAGASNSKDNRLEKLHFLLDAGAHFNFTNGECQRVMHFAGVYGDIKSLRLLESTGIYSQPDFSSLWGPKGLWYASFLGHADAVEFLVVKGAAIDLEEPDLTEHGELVPEGGLTAVMQAGSQEVLDILLRAGATISAHGGKKAKALLYAARGGKTALARALIDVGVDINKQEPRYLYSPLYWAAAKRRNEVLPLLIAAGANLELKTKGGQTALIHAAESNSTYAIGHLVRAGADVNVAAIDFAVNASWTPLQYAVRNANREMVCTLVRAGAEMSPEAQDYVNAMHHFIAAVLSTLPSSVPPGVRQNILNFVLEQHDGLFFKECPLAAAWKERNKNRAQDQIYPA